MTKEVGLRHPSSEERNRATKQPIRGNCRVEKVDGWSNGSRGPTIAVFDRPCSWSLGRRRPSRVVASSPPRARLNAAHAQRRLPCCPWSPGRRRPSRAAASPPPRALLCGSRQRRPTVTILGVGGRRHSLRAAASPPPRALSRGLRQRRPTVFIFRIRLDVVPSQQQPHHRLVPISLLAFSCVEQTDIRPFQSPSDDHSRWHLTE